MDRKLPASLGCLLFLAAAVAPGVVGHDDLFFSSGGAQHRYPLYPGAPDPNGVAGHYIGAAGPAVAIEASSHPDDTLAIGAMLCDLEVAGDGTAPAPQDEQNVDGSTGGLLTDTWDDGGIGGACHTVHYDYADYNTADCYSGALAYGRDQVSALDIWLGASCDWKTDSGGTSSGITFTLCVINEVILTGLGALVPCVEEIVDCLLDPTCGATGAVESCGADGVSDEINFGYGSGNPVQAQFPTNTGIVNPAPGVTGPCPDGAAAIFVFDTVAANDGTVIVYPAVVGDVWTSQESASVPECSDGVDNDGDGLTDYPFDLDCSDRNYNQEQAPATCIVELHLLSITVNKETEGGLDTWLVKTIGWGTKLEKRSGAGFALVDDIGLTVAKQADGNGPPTAGVNTHNFPAPTLIKSWETPKEVAMKGTIDVEVDELDPPLGDGDVTDGDGTATMQEPLVCPPKPGAVAKIPQKVLVTHAGGPEASNEAFSVTLNYEWQLFDP